MTRFDHGAWMVGLALASVVALVHVPETSAVAPRTLTLEQRIEYQRRIEKIRWTHRTETAAGEHGSFEAAMPETRIRNVVETYLRQGAILAEFWKRPLTAAQLQAEMERMARNTRAPDRLRELHAALDNDPFVIAECLARPTLTQRLMRNRYAADDRLHRPVRLEAHNAIAESRGSWETLRTLGHSYRETVWEKEPGSGDLGNPHAMRLPPDEWEELVDRISHLTGPGPVSAVNLREGVDRFYLQVVLEKTSTRTRIGTMSWDKLDLQRWWDALPASRSAVDDRPVEPVEHGYRANTVSAGACELDTWTPVLASGPPSQRYRHTAVWTGTEMIVWGGSSFHHSNGNIDYLDTGARYEPATDTWTPTSVGAGNPTPRLRHTAIWTGTEMIVFGGFDGQTLDTGARYVPYLRHLDPHEQRRVCPCAFQPHGGVDRKPHGRLGRWLGRGRCVRPGGRQLDTDRR